MNNFKQRTISGISWSMISQVTRQGISFVFTIILVRLLSPEEYGLLAMVTVFVGFVNLFVDLGLGIALIQKQNITQTELSSVFWLNISIGLIFTLIFILAAPFVSLFYNNPKLTPIIILLSFNFLIGSFGIIQNKLFQKNLQFKKLSIIEIASIAISGLIAVILALKGYGVWSITIQLFLNILITTIILWLIGNWRPSFIYRFSAIKKLMGFSINYLGTQTLGYWARNIDNILIGKLLGSEPLGIYSRAYAIMLLPLSNVSRVITKVLFPSLSIIQNDKERVKTIILKTTQVVALITFPIMTGLFIVAEPFVIVVFTSKWIGMVPVLKIFCAVGIIQSVTLFIGTIFLSQGKTSLMFRLNIIFQTITIAAIIIGLFWGIIGVAFAYTIANLIILYPAIYFSGKLINLTFSEFINNLKGVLFCSLMMGIIVFMISMLLPEDMSKLFALGIEIFTGMIVYIIIIISFKIPAYLELRKIIMERIYKRA